jgi:hypothetical protein
MNLKIFLLSACAMVNAASGESTVNLRTAGDFVILAKTGISTVPSSIITGDIAVSPITSAAITGFNLAMDSSNEHSTDTTEQLSGKAFAANYDGGSTASVLTTAVGDMETAYTDAAGRPNADAARTNLKGGLIGGETLTPGVYTFTVDVQITKDLTFDGSATDVFIIQTSSSVIQAANTNVILKNGALAKNIFWQVAEAVTVEAGAHLKGILLVKTAVTFVTGSSLNGRILAQTAANLQKATITQTPAVRRGLRGLQVA